MKLARFEVVFSVAGFCVAVALAGPAFAGLGDGFGTRDPIACPFRNLPRSGAPSQQQAMRYFACDMERIGDVGQNVYLVSQVQLQVSPKGRPFNSKADVAVGVDPAQPVYEIHGSFRLYQCGSKSGVSWQSNPGHACRYQEFDDTQGLCWKNTQAEWHCGLPFKFDIQRTVHDAEPPQ